MRWENNVALGNAGKERGRVYLNPLSIDTRYEAFAEGVYVGFDVDPAKLRRKVEAALVRRHFRHEWRGVALVVNGVDVGQYAAPVGSLLPLCLVHGKAVRRDTPNGCKAAAVAIAKREFLNRL